MSLWPLQKRVRCKGCALRARVESVGVRPGFGVEHVLWEKHCKSMTHDMKAPFDCPRLKAAARDWAARTARA